MTILNSKKKRLPFLQKALLFLILPHNDLQNLSGDFEELYHQKRKTHSGIWANFWITMQILISAPGFIKNEIYWKAAMLRSYLMITLRHMKKQIVNSTINIISLSIGLAFCVLIFLFIKDELSHDRFHKNADAVYNIICNDHYYEGALRLTPAPLAPYLIEHFHEIEKFVRIGGSINAVRYEDKIYQERVHLVDPQFFEVFSFPLLSGSPQAVLQSDNSVVITKSMANKYFGRVDPIGKILVIYFGEEQKAFEISGIVKDPPDNSSIQFHFLLNLNNLRSVEETDPLYNWNRDFVMTFILLEEATSAELIEKNILNLIKPFRGSYYERRKKYGSLKTDVETITYSLQNIKDFYLHSSNIRGFQKGSIQRSYILTGIALLMLLLGIVNFVNLSIARASRRALEIGVRKVLGADKKQFIRQFWGESLFIATISIVIGLTISALFLPVFNSLSNKNLDLNALYNPINLVLFLVLVGIVGIISGSFPGSVISKYQISDIFRGKFKIGGKNIFRKTLLLFQFSLSIFFVVSAFITSKQLNFIENYDPGFDKEGVLVIPLQETMGPQSQSVFGLFRDRIKNYSTVLNVSGCETSPNRAFLMGSIDVEGKRIQVCFNSVNYEYIETMKMTLVEGRNFSADFPTDESAVIINRKLAQVFDGSPVGKVIREGEVDAYPVIGVVEDFNFMSLEEEIIPVVISAGKNSRLNFALVRISSENVAETIEFLEASWKVIQPDKPFLYSFLDDDLRQFYTETERLNAIVNYTSILAVIVTCMGIFGLTLFTATSRVKEIGIRKVLGASFKDVINLFTKEVFTLVVLSIILALPLAYYFMIAWLQRFAYRTQLDILTFLSAGILVLFVSLLTVSYVAIKAAKANPVDSLKYE